MNRVQLPAIDKIGEVRCNCKIILNAVVAQQVEHRSEEPSVVRSIRSRGTNLNGQVAELVNCT